jgi:hypothetical protein
LAQRETRKALGPELSKNETRSGLPALICRRRELRKRTRRFDFLALQELPAPSPQRLIAFESGGPEPQPVKRQHLTPAARRGDQHPRSRLQVAVHEGALPASQAGAVVVDVTVCASREVLHLTGTIEVPLAQESETKRRRPIPRDSARPVERVVKGDSDSHAQCRRHASCPSSPNFRARVLRAMNFPLS